MQGLRPFSSSIPKTLKKHLRKGGYNYSSIIENWTKMVSKKISDACYPSNVKTGKEMKNNTLVLNVVHGKEMEIEYGKNRIIEKINSFFGYNCIGDITLKIVHEKISLNKKVFTKFKNLPETNEKVKKVKDEKLKNSLSDFLKAYNERNR